MTTPGPQPGWIVAAGVLRRLIGAAGFRSTPGILIVPLQAEFGWSRGVLSVAVGNLLRHAMGNPDA